MPATVELFERGWLVRFGVKHKGYGDPFYGQAFIKPDGEHCTIKVMLIRGKDEKLRKDDRDAILDQCRRLGFKSVRYERIRKGRPPIWFSYDLTASTYHRARL